MKSIIQNAKLIVFVIGLASSAAAQCPKNTILDTAVQPSAAVTVVVNSDATPFGANTSANSALINGVYDGLGSQNYSDGTAGNNSGIAFTNVDSSSTSGTAANPVFNMVFNNTPGQTSPKGGVAETSLQSVGGKVFGGTITIYLGANVCAGPCYDGDAASFQAAISTAVQHELTHTLGIGDAAIDISNAAALNGSTAMGRWIGVNNTGKTEVGQQLKDAQGNSIPGESNGDTNCDAKMVKKSQNCPCRTSK